MSRCVQEYLLTCRPRVGTQLSWVGSLLAGLGASAQTWAGGQPASHSGFPEQSP